MSCEADSPCLTLTLDCVDGVDCVSFEAAASCACEGGCNSEIVTCQ